MRKKTVQKSVMHVQSCYFYNKLDLLQLSYEQKSDNKLYREKDKTKMEHFTSFSLSFSYE